MLRKNIFDLKSVFLVIFILCLTFFATPNVGVGQTLLGYGSSCNRVFNYQAVSIRDYSQIKELKIMAYNVENLFWSVGKYDSVSPNQMKMNPANPPQQKSEKDFETIRKIIKDINPDVAILPEVESLVALTHLAQAELGNYKSLLIEGNDARGINIGFLIKNDLPFLIEQQTHKDEMWFDPISQQTVKLFSRDVPALLLRKDKSSAPFLIVLGNHAKSKRDRPGDPGSEIVRKAQYDRIVEIIESYKKQFGENIPILLGGDYNTDVQHAPELDLLNKSLSSAFSLAKDSTPKSELITHTFHPRDGPTQKSQMDDIKISSSLGQSVIEAKVYRYRNPDGSIMPFADSYEQRSLQPSDHLPIYITISTQKLF